MAKAIQYSSNSGVDWTQLPVGGLTTADITLQGGTVSNYFESLKDSNDNLYIYCGYPSVTYNSDIPGKIIKITSTGVKTFANLISSAAGYSTCYSNVGGTILLSRDEQTLFVACGQSAYGNKSVDVDVSLLADPAVDINVTTGKMTKDSYNRIFRDLYVWKATGTFVYIYTYSTMVQLASKEIRFQGNGTFMGTSCTSLCCSSDNELYYINRSGFYIGDVRITSNISKITFNGSDTISYTPIATLSANYSVEYYNKQMVIDKFNDLIILTNSGSTSNLLKYTTAGALIDEISLGGSYYNLNTDYLGNYYYSNALNYYKIPAGTAQGQVFNSPSKIRDTGSTSYNNNDTGYYPSIN